MCNILELDFEGKEHSGIDDAINIAKIIQKIRIENLNSKNNKL